MKAIVPLLRCARYSGAKSPVPDTFTVQSGMSSVVVLYQTRSGTVNLPPEMLICMSRAL